LRVFADHQVRRESRKKPEFLKKGGQSIDFRLQPNGLHPIQKAQLQKIEAGSMLDAATVLSEPDPSRRPLEPGVKAISRLGLLELIGPIVGGQAAVKARRKNQNGPTALMIVGAAGHAEAVDDLLAAGASPSLRDCDGFSALSYAAALGHAAIVHALVLAGAEIDPIRPV